MIKEMLDDDYNVSMQSNKVTLEQLEGVLPCVNSKNPFLTKDWLFKRGNMGECDDVQWLVVYQKNMLLAAIPLKRITFFNFTLGYLSIEYNLFDYDDLAIFNSKDGADRIATEVLSYIKLSKLFYVFVGVMGDSILIKNNKAGLSELVFSSHLSGSISLANLDETISKRLQKNIRYNIRRLNNIGNEEIKVASFESLDSIKTLFEMKLDNLLSAGKASRLFSASIRDKIHDMHLNNDSSKIYQLILGNKILASVLIIEEGSYLGYYMPAYNPDFAKFSPSNILLYELIKLALKKNKYLTLDLMKGDEDYKRKWLKNTDAEHIYIMSNIPKSIIRFALPIRSFLVSIFSMLTIFTKGNWGNKKFL